MVGVRMGGGGGGGNENKRKEKNRQHNGYHIILWQSLNYRTDAELHVVSVPDPTNPSMDCFSIPRIVLEAIHALDTWSGKETNAEQTQKICNTRMAIPYYAL